MQTGAREAADGVVVETSAVQAQAPQAQVRGSSGRSRSCVRATSLNQITQNNGNGERVSLSDAGEAEVRRRKGTRGYGRGGGRKGGRRARGKRRCGGPGRRRRRGGSGRQGGRGRRRGARRPSPAGTARSDLEGEAGAWWWWDCSRLLRVVLVGRLR